MTDTQAPAGVEAMIGSTASTIVRPAFWVACACVAVLSLLPADRLPANMFTWWDKAQHALAFAVLAALGQFAYLSKRRLVLVGLTAYGALIEIAQHATGWRYGEVSDWVADLVGIGLGWVLVLAMSEKLGR